MKKRNRKNFITHYWSHSKLWKIVSMYVILTLITIAAFSALYSSINNSIQFNDCSSIKPELASKNYFYFSSVTYYSIGYGDICPVTTESRIFTQIEVATGAIINALFIGFIFWKIIGAHLRT